MLAVTVIVVALAGGYLVITKPSYTATTELLVDPRDVKTTNIDSVLPGIGADVGGHRQSGLGDRVARSAWQGDHRSPPRCRPGIFRRRRAAELFSPVGPGHPRGRAREIPRHDQCRARGADLRHRRHRQIGQSAEGRPDRHRHRRPLHRQHGGAAERRNDWGHRDPQHQNRGAAGRCQQGRARCRRLQADQQHFRRHHRRHAAVAGRPTGDAGARRAGRAQPGADQVRPSSGCRHLARGPGAALRRLGPRRRSTSCAPTTTPKPRRSPAPRQPLGRSTRSSLRPAPSSPRSRACLPAKRAASPSSSKPTETRRKPISTS